jgi:hypothetical protein
MDALASDIDPDECIAPFVVDGALADDVSCVEDQSWRHLSAPQPPAAHWRRSKDRHLFYEESILTIVSATDCIQSLQSYHNGQDG